MLQSSQEAQGPAWIQIGIPFSAAPNRHTDTFPFHLHASSKSHLPSPCAKYLQGPPSFHTADGFGFLHPPTLQIPLENRMLRILGHHPQDHPVIEQRNIPLSPLYQPPPLYPAFLWPGPLGGNLVRGRHRPVKHRRHPQLAELSSAIPSLMLHLQSVT